MPPRSRFKPGLMLTSSLIMGLATFAGCGGGGSHDSRPLPISVSLAIATVTVSQDGVPVIVPIRINSTSETANVAVTGLPAGLQETYASSDTNPSGTLRFVASASTQSGTFQPSVTVNSAGAMASTMFTLVVTK